jgi:hypothetical protein
MAGLSNLNKCKLDNKLTTKVENNHSIEKNVRQHTTEIRVFMISLFESYFFPYL